MIRYLILAALLGGCIIETSSDVRTVTGCDVIEERGQCDAGPVCIPVENALLTGVAYAYQCGGSGTAEQPADADDCIEVSDRAAAVRDEVGDQICVSCTDIDGDTGPSSANPWTYLIVGVCEFGTPAEAEAAEVYTESVQLVQEAEIE